MRLNFIHKDEAIEVYGKMKTLVWMHTRVIKNIKANQGVGNKHKNYLSKCTQLLISTCSSLLRRRAKRTLAR
jgi:hypothetical protein